MLPVMPPDSKRSIMVLPTLTVCDGGMTVVGDGFLSVAYVTNAREVVMRKRTSWLSSVYGPLQKRTLSDEAALSWFWVHE